MFNNFLICLNGILPIFLLIFAGYLFKKTKLLDEGFSGKANNLVFKVALPCVLFYDIATGEIKSQFDARLVAVTIGATVIMFAISWIFSIIATPDNRERAAFAQGAFRTNYTILGIPLTKALFSESIAANVPVISLVSIPIFNIFAVILLTLQLGKEKNFGSVFKGIAKNPLIIGAVFGVLVSVFNISIPAFLMKTISYIAQMCTPLSLIVIGASFIPERIKETARLAAWASFIKTFAMPIIFLYPAYLIGVQGAKLGVLFIFLAAPSAISGYVMTRNMGGDYDLAGNIVMISTIMSFFSIFAGMMIMKTIGIF